MGEIEIRRVRPGDGPVFGKIRLDALLDTPSAFGSSHADEILRTDDDWAAIASERSAGFLGSGFIAFDDGEAVGLIGGWWKDPDLDVVDLVSMFVRPSHRGTAVATRLVDTVIEWARAGGAAAVELWVTEGNERATAFYRRCGFALNGEHAPLPSDPTQQEIRMGLPL